MVPETDNPFVIIVHPDGFCDYIYDAAEGHQVGVDRIEEIVASYRRDGQFTIVFDLDGREPRVLPNTEKGTYENIPSFCGCPHSNCCSCH
ncbi:hypothetical protein LCGC14_0963780 [marine sediment metagenome]|uniref:Uncharacterized protein n=1 Tax=marine sediment metagenome TaxID=412755 RepID=A0A0F9QWU1_9ZZZZ